jgi:uncharacterized membrane protein
MRTSDRAHVGPPGEAVVEILDPFDEGLEFLFRYAHYLSGVTWIGILYYFNFVQTPAYAELTAPARTEAFEHNTRRALWWFRFGAMATVGTGIIIIGLNSGDGGGEYSFDNVWGTSIFTGGLIGIVMFLNVWLVIWPNQQVVLANARNVLAGGEANPAVPTHARAGAMASRTNTFFSFPMLWFMAFTSHFSSRFGEGVGEIDGGKSAIYWILVLAFIAVVELIGLGIIGGRAVGGPLHFHIEQHKNTIIAGLVATLVIHVVLWEIIIGS